MHKHTNTLFVKQRSPKGKCAWAESFIAAKTTALKGRAGICSTNHWGGCQIKPNAGWESLMLLGFANSTTSTDTHTHMHKQPDECVFLHLSSHLDRWLSFWDVGSENKEIREMQSPHRHWCLQVNRSSLWRKNPCGIKDQNSQPFLFFYSVVQDLYSFFPPLFQ